MIDKIKNLRSNDSGFTIVELLIVIVVIGILAAITIVSYTGITQQATLAQYKQDASSIVNVGEIVYNDTGDYPQTKGEFDNQYAQLPSSIDLGTPLGSSDPDPTSTEAAVDSTDGVSTYIWKACGVAEGFVVYYPDADATNGVGKLAAGAGC